MTEKLRDIDEELRGKAEEAYRDPEKCLHQTCQECHGTGRKKDGSACIHMISCPCKGCNRFHY